MEHERLNKVSLPLAPSLLFSSSSCSFLAVSHWQPPKMGWLKDPAAFSRPSRSARPTAGLPCGVDALPCHALEVQARGFEEGHGGLWQKTRGHGFAVAPIESYSKPDLKMVCPEP